MFAVRVIFIWVLGTLILICPGAVDAQPPPVPLHADGGYKLDRHIEIFEDESGALTIDEVASPALAGSFRQPDKGSIYSLAFTKSAFWVRFRFEGNSIPGERRYLSVFHHILDDLRLYTPRRDGGFTVSRTGRLIPVAERLIRHRDSLLPLPDLPPGLHTLYLRVQSESGLALPITLHSTTSLGRHDRRARFFEGGYFGLMTAMFLYNLFLFFTLRDRAYLFYTLYVLSLIFYQFCVDGLAAEYLWPHSVWWHRKSDMVFAPLSICFGALFAREFLGPRIRSNRYGGIFKGLAFLSMAPIILVFAVNYTIAVQTSVTTLLMFIITAIAAGISSWRAGFRPARFFLLAWSLYLLALFILVLSEAGLLPLGNVIMEIIPAGSALEAMLLSFALADRINVLREEREEARTEAMRLGHLASLGDLAAYMAHEINNPVGGIINYAELLQKEENSGELPARIIREAHRIASLVRGLLGFARRDERRIAAVNMAEALNEALLLAGGSLRKAGIEVETDLSRGLPPVAANQQKLEQVFLNVLANARYALQEKGGSQPDRRLAVGAEEIAIDGDFRLRIIFRDNGPGIPANLLDRIFEPFFTTKPKGAGTGIGLTISRGIIAEFGGAMALESVEGEGTTVTIDLPVMAP